MDIYLKALLSIRGTLLGLGACQADLDLIDMLIRREKNEDR